MPMTDAIPSNTKMGAENKVSSRVIRVMTQAVRVCAKSRIRMLRVIRSSVIPTIAISNPGASKWSVV